MSEFIDEVASAARLETQGRGVSLIVLPMEDGLTIEADRQILAAVVGNLLQNAFKFTRPQTTVTLRVHASLDRVLIEVEDECGGLPDGADNALFQPFEQRNANRTGLGVGLAFSRWAAEANNARLYTRNHPNRGCVFVLDLPRFAVGALEMSNGGYGRNIPPLLMRRTERARPRGRAKKGTRTREFCPIATQQNVRYNTFIFRLVPRLR